MMKCIRLLLVCLLLSTLLVACDTAPTATPFLLCPTATPGVEVYQGEIRPQIPSYPNAQGIQVIAPVPPEYFLDTPIPQEGNTTRLKKLTRFGTADSAQQVISFYKKGLTNAGWIEQVKVSSSSEISVSFGYSAESTIYAAMGSNPCAPTPMTGFPGHQVEVIIIEATASNTIVEVREGYIPGY